MGAGIEGAGVRVHARVGAAGRATRLNRSWIQLGAGNRALRKRSPRGCSQQPGALAGRLGRGHSERTVRTYGGRSFNEARAVGKPELGALSLKLEEAPAALTKVAPDGCQRCKRASNHPAVEGVGALKLLAACIARTEFPRGSWFGATVVLSPRAAHKLLLSDATS